MHSRYDLFYFLQNYQKYQLDDTQMPASYNRNANRLQCAIFEEFTSSLRRIRTDIAMITHWMQNYKLLQFLFIESMLSGIVWLLSFNHLIQFAVFLIFQIVTNCLAVPIFLQLLHGRSVSNLRMKTKCFYFAYSLICIAPIHCIYAAVLCDVRLISMQFAKSRFVMVYFSMHSFLFLLYFSRKLYRKCTEMRQYSYLQSNGVN